MKKNIKSIIIYLFLLIFFVIAVKEFVLNITDKTKPLIVDREGRGNDSNTPSKGVYQGLPEHVINVMQKSIETPDPNPVVGVGRGSDFGQVTEDAIRNAGGIEDIIEEGDVVLIKPNLCMDARPDTPITTDYRVVEKIVEMVKAQGASRVIIAEGGFMGKNFSEAALERNQYDKIEDVEFVNINDYDVEDSYFLMTENSVLGRELYVPKIYMDVDKVISVAKLKTHFQPEAVVTLSIKNAYGAISSKLYGGSNKIGLHNMGFMETMLEINKIRRPDFVVIDGIIAGEGYGPTNNTPVDANIIFAGKDLAAVDTIALNFMGFTVDEVPHVAYVGEHNLGIIDYNQITVEGADIEAIKISFRR